MFATLAGGYPRPDLGPDATPDDYVHAILAEQAGAGIEILSDAGFRHDDPIAAIAGALEGFDPGDLVPLLQTGRTYRMPIARHEPRWDGPILVADWQAATAFTDMPVKQSLVGPYTLARLADAGPVGRERLTMALADVLAHELRALIAAGVPMIQVDEDAAPLIADSPSEQRLFKAAHRRLTNGLGEAHLTLAVTGGSVAGVPAAVFFDAPYRSYLIDVVTAPENWRLIASAPAERGVILGVADARTDDADDPAFLTWAGTNVAAMGGRGPERVGLAPSGSLAQRTPAAALEKIATLARVGAETHAQIGADAARLDLAALTRDGLERGYLREVAERSTSG